MMQRNNTKSENLANISQKFLEKTRREMMRVLEFDQKAEFEIKIADGKRGGLDS